MRVLDLSALEVLVADPSAYMRKIHCAMLAGFGFVTIRDVADGALALEALRAHPVDLVIADFALATLDGVELAERLRAAEDGPNCYVPIIMLSAYTEKWRIEAARDAGVTEFLRKPFCAKDLYLRIEEVIERPRNFVRTPRYFGPDRHRNGKFAATPPSRRERETF
jgi:CheY-like chemotaxis protein